MKIAKIIIIMFAILPMIVSCKKTMTLEDYAKIDMEIVQSDQKPETKGQISKKFGFSLKQYEEMAKKVEQDKTLQEELGKINLKKMQDQNK